MESPRFKMFKQGKCWCVSAIAIVGIAIGMGSGDVNVSADNISTSSISESDTLPSNSSSLQDAESLFVENNASNLSTVLDANSTTW
jgi:hypothetical protein